VVEPGLDRTTTEAIVINQVIVGGVLTQEVDLSHTAAGTPVARLQLEVQHTPFGDERPPQTCEVEVVQYGPMAEVMNRYLEGGRSVIIHGHFEQEEGKGLVVVSERFQFVERGVSSVPLWRKPSPAMHPTTHPIPVAAGAPAGAAAGRAF
jgi:single-stranded DNA-binding protein